MGVKVAFLEMSGPRQRTKQRQGAAGGGRSSKRARCAPIANASFVFLVRDGKVERRAVSLGMEIADGRREYWRASPLATRWSSKGLKSLH